MEGRSAFKILTGKPTGKRPLGRPRRRWEDNIRMDFEDLDTKEIEGEEFREPRNVVLEETGEVKMLREIN